MGIAASLFQRFFLLFLLFPISINSATLGKTPRLSPLGPKFLRDPSKTIPSSSSVVMKDFETKYYEQTLDHFNYRSQSYATFKQKYVIYSKYWGGANSSSPIFAYLGDEEALQYSLPYVGTLTDNAPHFKALLVYIEHRFYGDSIPFGLNDEAVMKDESIRGNFSSVQALADYAEILLHVKKMLCAPNSPIIVVGASYGGMLAAWFRLKYPHVAMGAVAISAPILYFDGVTPQDAYFSVVQKDFKEQSESCFDTIQKSWDIIYKVGSEPNGLSILSRKFKACSQLTTIHDLSDFLATWYSATAQYDAPPTYPVKLLCEGIDGVLNATDALNRLAAGIQNFYASYYGEKLSCFHLSGFSNYTVSSWDWQTCSDMVIPIGGSSNITIVREKPFSMEQKIKNCKKYYGVSPRPHWATTYYGGQDIKLVLGKFGSNIIFSNGLRDPYSSGGVLENLSDSLVAIYTKKGSHCLDLFPAEKTDPKWLVNQRKKEVQVLEKWIAKYYADLSALKK